MSVTRLFDLLDGYRDKYSWKEDALVDKVNGEWKPVSAVTFLETVDLVSYGLKAIGLQPGDKIATLSNNRSEWHFIDLGMMRLGAVHVPIYPTISENDLQFILKDAEVKFVFVSSEVLFHKVNRACQGLTGVKDIFSFENVPGARNWSEITAMGSRNPDPEGVKAVSAQIGQFDLATLLYTSGTT